MAKYKKTLNDVDRFWIDHNAEATVAELSKKLKVTAETIRSYQDNKPAPSHVTTVKSGKKDLFARKGGSIIMTPAQSEQLDKQKPHSGPEYMKSCVHTFETKDND